MRLEHHEFTGTLKGKIMEAERKFAKLCEDLTLKYKPIAAMKQLDVEIQMFRDGHDSYIPGYRSEIALGVSRNEVPLDTHVIVIWACSREFLGLPVKWNLPGSKVVGEFLDETFEQVALELEELLGTFLQDDHTTA
ncbi:hypothetical protein GE107_18815 [Cohnella sp. CFH 77786]|uniref:hypothetical protein n=1 Tax=Cohnella sp. CFH 77786 TaxID=2662265 RepID=UPI001C60EE47|nr:hypothetical protein [Cohnella sp. CFH 77786]MBW5448113.1 hypothetical protein [Cohnella sp. CFH 77786]